MKTVLGLRGVDVNALAERPLVVGSVPLLLSRERGRRALLEHGALGARSEPRIVWMTAVDGVHDASISRRACAVLVRALDASSVASS